MLRSMYTAGTAMLTYTRKMDVITNNLTNVETRGFKADTLATRSFRDLMIDRLNDPSFYRYDSVGPHNTGIHVDQVYTGWQQGPLENTGVSTDFALTGDGFFVIDYTGEYDDEPVERYTRNGAFNVDAEGMLVTGDGRYVLGEGGPIEVGGMGFIVGEDGYVYDAYGDMIDRLRVVRFIREDEEGEELIDNSSLRKAGDNMFFNFDPENYEAQDIDEGVSIVKQGYLENSNVDTAREMVNMMQTYRAYEINQRILRMIDESLGRAVNDIARI
ncbi:MAG: flagellar hook-basal body protein [Oscillospiraceae bacterium]|nr:flagellar hook-basal body protein [Oscillospiraceae bacterium]